MLILDGHSSHATAEFDRFCTERNIIPLYMPPHSSHLLQPLDVGCFSPLKHLYGQRITNKVQRESMLLIKQNFSISTLPSITRHYLHQIFKAALLQLAWSHFHLIKSFQSFIYHSKHQHHLHHHIATYPLVQARLQQI